MGSAQLLLGVNGTARAASIAALYRKNPRPMLIISDTQVHADQFFDDLSSLLEDLVYNFPAEESIATEMAISSSELRLQRVQTLLALKTENLLLWLQVWQVQNVWYLKAVTGTSTFTC